MLNYLGFALLAVGIALLLIAVAMRPGGESGDSGRGPRKPPGAV